ncbi:MAG: hypothetical protein DCF32_09545 [Leptolyngbya sp.]|nr:MAG: hypothetical protein DCF32_09545 [Leptolyngbya sp.]
MYSKFNQVASGLFALGFLLGGMSPALAQPPSGIASPGAKVQNREEMPEKRCAPGEDGGGLNCTSALDLILQRLKDKAPDPQCGSHDEDHKDCSQEGRQSTDTAGG